MDEPERPSTAVREDCTVTTCGSRRMSTFLDPRHTAGAICALSAQGMTPEYRLRSVADLCRCAVADGSENVPIAEDPEPGLAASNLAPNSFEANREASDLHFELFLVEQNPRGLLPTGRSCGCGAKGTYRGQRRNSQRRREPRRHWRRLARAGAAGTQSNPAAPVRAPGGRHAD